MASGFLSCVAEAAGCAHPTPCRLGPTAGALWDRCWEASAVCTVPRGGPSSSVPSSWGLVAPCTQSAQLPAIPGADALQAVRMQSFGCSEPGVCILLCRTCPAARRNGVLAFTSDPAFVSQRQAQGRNPAPNRFPVGSMHKQLRFLCFWL